MSHTIEKKSEYGQEYFAVYEIGRYPRSSVLAGQDRKTFIDAFDTIEEAKAEFPNADVGFFDPMNTFAHLPGDDDLDGQGGVWYD